MAVYVKPSKLSMLDKAEKTYQLLAALKAAAPFEVELTPPVIAHLRTQQIAVKPQ
ncbi:MAG: hypothetical protein ACR652_17460 [Methylocystis sp.]|uniref:hypothetical protein n=1 Tax=Methylocystis sp. TaxID=1911079 RepID=UPI003DA6AF9E